MRALLIRCYPAVWRERYGDEFEAVLDERPLGPFDVADILLGALDARLRLRDRRAGLSQRKGFSMSLRIGGIAAILGAMSLATAWFLGSGFFAVNDTLAGFLLLLGLGLLLVAVAGLTAFQARIDPALSWAAFVLLAIGTIVAMVAFVGAATLGGDGYWNLGTLGLLTAIFGTLLFAIVTYQTAALSRGAALLLAAGAVLPFVGMVSSLTILVVPALLCFLLGWFLLGIQAIRLDRPATDPRPA
jgi:hypothetical protein